MAETPRFVTDCRSRTLVGDGAMGTELQRAGLQPGESGEAWNLDRPDAVEAIHRAYLDAGSDAIITNTFGANRWVLGRYGLAERVEEINRAAAVIARRAAGAAKFVLGDIGPCGGFLEPLGDIDGRELQEAFRRQAHALLDGGADGIIVETMTALEEIVAAVHAARGAGAPFVIGSMAFDRLPNGSLKTNMGVAPEKAAAALAAAGADVIGANCGTRLEVEDFGRLAAAFTAAAGLPVMVQPNAGQPDLVDGRAVYRLAPAAFAVAMRPVLLAGGVGVAGGCCGTTPAHIRALAEVVGGRR